MEANLSTTFVGVELCNPIVIASSPLTESEENIRNCEEKGAGAVIAKSCTSFNHESRGFRRCLINSRGWWASSTFDREIQSVSVAVKYLRSAIKNVEIPIFGSVSELSLNKQEWLQSCKLVEDTGVSGIQLDLFYFNNLMNEEEFDKQLVDLLEYLSEKIDVPIFPKMNINLPSNYMVSILKNSSIFSVSVLDSISLPPPIDIHKLGSCSLKNIINPQNASLFGAWQLPLTIKYLYDFRQSGFEVCAGGGVTSPEDIIELAMYGASTIQVATDIILNGYDRIDTYIQGLANFLEVNNINSFSDINGVAIPLKSNEVKYKNQKAKIDLSKCVYCMKCVTQQFCKAINVIDKQITINEELCEGCSLCVDLCDNSAIGLE